MDTPEVLKMDEIEEYIKVIKSNKYVTKVEYNQEDEIIHIYCTPPVALTHINVNFVLGDFKDA